MDELTRRSPAAVVMDVRHRFHILSFPSARLVRKVKQKEQRSQHSNPGDYVEEKLLIQRSESKNMILSKWDEQSVVRAKKGLK